MADESENALESEQWIAKTNFPIGVDFSLPPPLMRYQYLAGQMFTLQVMPAGDIIRGVIAPTDTGFDLTAGEGWYDEDGDFLGDDPGLDIQA